MSKDTPKLTCEQVLVTAMAGLQTHLEIPDEGYKRTLANLSAALVGVTSQQMTLEQVCEHYPGMPSVKVLREYLNAHITPEQLSELEAQINAALQAQIPAKVWQKARDIALDEHDRPYYGKASQEEGLWVYGCPKASTKRFYRVLSAYVMYNHLRVTLAVVFIIPQKDTLAGVKALLAHIQQLKIPVRCLWMDKGYASVPIMRFLDTHGWSAVIANPIRGKPTGKGTRSLCRGRKSYTTTHQFESHQHEKFTAQVAVRRCYQTTRHKGKKLRKATWLVFILINVAYTPQQVGARYRHRFGIETSYRCSRKIMGWTTASNPAYRFLLMGLAFYLYNIWVRLCWEFTQVPRRGGRYLDKKLFRLARLKSFLLHALEAIYGYVAVIEAYAHPLL